MALGGCYNCLKYLMFVFNFIFWLVGCALLAVGIWAKVDESSFSELIDDPQLMRSLSIAAYVIIAVGAIVMVLGFLGCCGAIRESQCMLATFFIFLFIIFSTLLAVGIYVYIEIKPDPEMLKGEIKKAWTADVNSYYNSTDAKKRLDAARDEFHCCGSEQGDMVKTWGVIKAGEACGQYVTSEGCATKVYEKTHQYLKKYLVIFVGVAFGIATIMLLGMIFSMLLCCAIRETSM